MLVNRTFKELLVFLLLTEVVIMFMAIIWISLGQYSGQLFMLILQVMYVFGILLSSASAAAHISKLAHIWMKLMKWEHNKKFPLSRSSGGSAPRELVHFHELSSGMQTLSAIDNMFTLTYGFVALVSTIYLWGVENF